jgi:hypothetical protein
MYYQNKQDKQIVLSAFKVTRANFTGEAFDNAPFEGDTGHDWLEQAMLDGVVSLVPGGETTYAVWGVRTPDGEIMLASPGDYIVQDVGAEAIHVCPGPIWELLTEFLPEAEAPAPLPTAEQVEQIVEGVQGQVDQAHVRLKQLSEDVKFGRTTDWHAVATEVKQIREVLGKHIPADFDGLLGAVSEHTSPVLPADLRQVAMDYLHLAGEWIGEDGWCEFQEKITFAKRILRDETPADFDALKEKVDLNAAAEETAMGILDDRQQQINKVRRQAIGTKDAAIALYHSGIVLSPKEWEPIRWSLAWARMVLGEPTGEVHDEIHEELAKRAKYGRYADAVVEHMPASIFPEDTVLIKDEHGVVHGSAHVGQAFEMEPAQELPVGGSAAGLQGVIDAREMTEELAVMMNDFCDEAYRMYERLKYGDRFDWKAFHARGLEIADPEKVDQKLVFVKVMGVAEHLTHLDIVTHADMLIAQTKVGIVARQREDMHKALEYVNTARMWIFETASTEERDWIEMQKNLTWSHVVLSIHEQVPEDFDKVSGAVDHMIGSYPLSK